MSKKVNLEDSIIDNLPAIEQSSGGESSGMAFGSGHSDLPSLVKEESKNHYDNIEPDLDMSGLTEIAEMNTSSTGIFHEGIKTALSADNLIAEENKFEPVDLNKNSSFNTLLDNRYQ
jgi:hypothetical protein